MAIGVERNQIEFLARQLEDGTATLSAMWEYKNKRVGVWVRYKQETSHKEAFSILCQGIWEAMQSPLDFIVEQENRGEMEVEPYWDGLK
jgi:hypothetical protein